MQHVSKMDEGVDGYEDEKWHEKGRVRIRSRSVPLRRRELKLESDRAKRFCWNNTILIRGDRVLEERRRRPSWCLWAAVSGSRLQTMAQRGTEQYSES